MSDVHSSGTRSKNMSRIKSKDTKPELLIRKVLFSRGFRYRLHRNDLPGTPDIVLAKHNTAIFVHGCFWHRHGCSLTTTPATRRDWWKQKLQANRTRDKRNIIQLHRKGCRVFVFWQCSIQRGSRRKQAEHVVSSFEQWLHGFDIYGEASE